MKILKIHRSQMIKGGFWIAAFSLIVTFQDLSAYDASPKCFKEIQTDFFQETTITTALSFHRHRIYQSQWFRISRDLVKTNKRIPDLMEKYAKRLPRNPLEQPFQYEAAEKLLYSVTWDLFIEVMDSYYIKNQYTLQRVFSYIFNQESGRIRACLELD